MFCDTLPVPLPYACLCLHSYYLVIIGITLPIYIGKLNVLSGFWQDHRKDRVFFFFLFLGISLFFCTPEHLSSWKLEPASSFPHQNLYTLCLIATFYAAIYCWILCSNNWFIWEAIHVNELIADTIYWSLTGMISSMLNSLQTLSCKALYDGFIIFICKLGSWSKERFLPLSEV